MKKSVEIRSYNLKPGTRVDFHRAMTQEALPLLLKWKVDVVAWGPSPHDENSYYLIRCYDSLEHRETCQNVFYSSTDWRLGPRESIVSHIENYTSIVLELGKEMIDALRNIASR